MDFLKLFARLESASDDLVPATEAKISVMTAEEQADARRRARKFLETVDRFDGSAASWSSIADQARMTAEKFKLWLDRMKDCSSFGQIVPLRGRIYDFRTFQFMTPDRTVNLIKIEYWMHASEEGRGIRFRVPGSYVNGKFLVPSLFSQDQLEATECQLGDGTSALLPVTKIFKLVKAARDAIPIGPNITPVTWVEIHRTVDVVHALLCHPLHAFTPELMSVPGSDCLEAPLTPVTSTPIDIASIA